VAQLEAAPDQPKADLARSPAQLIYDRRVRDVVGVIEAAYQYETAEAEWLAKIAQHANDVLGRGLGVATYTYQPGPGGEPQIQQLGFAGEFDQRWIPNFQKRMGESVKLLDRPPIAWRTWFHIPCGTASQVRELDALTAGLVEFGGARDILSINGRDPRGFGVWLGVPLPRRTRLSEIQERLLKRLAAHFAAGQRIRQKLAGVDRPASNAEAVLSPSGELLHAEGQARTRAARDELRQAVIRVDRARSQSGRRDADQATEDWKALVEARWTLIDSFERDGKRFVLAERNEIEMSGPRSLTLRERQVLGCASLGQSNKEIAYALGLSPSTVRVLMARAAHKLGAGGRADAVKRFRSLDR
jgi:DNA-binding CsgD family transcriptional regulator